MNIQRQDKIYPYIPLLDKGFDTKSPELADFISSHAQASNEDCYIMQFNEKLG